jgi:hypothetical protein
MEEIFESVDIAALSDDELDDIVGGHAHPNGPIC